MWYEAYGKPTCRRESDGDETAASHYGNPYLFQGQRYCPETGLYYFKNRDYSPTLGRFVQRDRLPSNNGYQFLGSKPTVSVDPFGYQELPKPYVDELIGGAARALSRAAKEAARRSAEAIEEAAKEIVSETVRRATERLFCMKRVRDKHGNDTPPAGYTGDPDTFKHCNVACEITTQCSHLEGFVASWGKEAQDVFGKGDAEWRDLQNDKEGRKCAADPQGCKDCCCGAPQHNRPVPPEPFDPAREGWYEWVDDPLLGKIYIDPELLPDYWE